MLHSQRNGTLGSLAKVGTLRTRAHSAFRRALLCRLNRCARPVLHRDISRSSTAWALQLPVKTVLVRSTRCKLATRRLAACASRAQVQFD